MASRAAWCSCSALASCASRSATRAGSGGSRLRALARASWRPGGRRTLPARAPAVGGCVVGELDGAGGQRVEEGAAAAALAGEEGFAVLALLMVQLDGAVVQVGVLGDEAGPAGLAARHRTQRFEHCHGLLVRLQRLGCLALAAGRHSRCCSASCPRRPGRPPPARSPAPAGSPPAPRRSAPGYDRPRRCCSASRPRRPGRPPPARSPAPAGRSPAPRRSAPGCRRPSRCCSASCPRRPGRPPPARWPAPAGRPPAPRRSAPGCR